MKSIHQKALRAGSLAAALVAGVVLSVSTSVRADGDDRDGAEIRRGFVIAPVPLNLHGKNREMVGLGSYIVNAQGGCNDCHTNPPYAVGGDPYQGQPKKINAAAYLAGGMAFGPFTSRNLTPDKSGKPAGGLSFAEFVQIMRTGIDLDHAHPQFGPLLQVMPWPVYQSMTERDLRAIYEYLSAIPCIEGDPGIPLAPTTGRCK
jgi:hypothetical protein